MLELWCRSIRDQGRTMTPAHRMTSHAADAFSSQHESAELCGAQPRATLWLVLALSASMHREHTVLTSTFMESLVNSPWQAAADSASFWAQ